mmetsp:Transcript_38875/g.103252  ORF Transcript_38875/g.103252 Transcript_38875/m.103252 type:complete len:389 (-) Transcript_38875:60-1226(-)
MTNFILVGGYTETLGHVFSPSVPDPLGLNVFSHHATVDGFGELTLSSRMDVGPNPSWICTNRARNVVYVVNETDDSKEENLVSAYSFERSSGTLTLINNARTGGHHPCHMRLSNKERFLVVSNYTSGSFALFRVREDGGVGELTSFVQHQGCGKHTRQEGPHAHSGYFDAADAHLFVADLGTDEVKIYAVDEQGKVAEKSSLMLASGSGPRHLSFHPSGRFLYVLAELRCAVSTYSWDPETGVATEVGGPVSVVPEGTKVGDDTTNCSASISLSPDGRFVYASNRGHDSIAVLAVGDSGLTLIGLTRTSPDPAAHEASAFTHPAKWPPVQCPRDFNFLGENGRWVLVANQDTDNFVALDRDFNTGLLTLASTNLGSLKCTAPVVVLPM